MLFLCPSSRKTIRPVIDPTLEKLDTAGAFTTNQVVANQTRAEIPPNTTTAYFPPFPFFTGKVFSQKLEERSVLGPYTATRVPKSFITIKCCE